MSLSSRFSATHSRSRTELTSASTNLFSGKTKNALLYETSNFLATTCTKHAQCNLGPIKQTGFARTEKNQWTGEKVPQARSKEFSFVGLHSFHIGQYCKGVSVTEKEKKKKKKRKKEEEERKTPLYVATVWRARPLKNVYYVYVGCILGGFIYLFIYF